MTYETTMTDIRNIEEEPLEFNQIFKSPSQKAEGMTNQQSNEEMNDVY